MRRKRLRVLLFVDHRSPDAWLHVFRLIFLLPFFTMIKMAAKSDSPSIFQCDFCPYSSPKKCNLKIHYLETHGLKEDNLSNLFKVKSTIPCHHKECNDKFATKTQLIHHLNVQHFSAIEIHEDLAGNSDASKLHFAQSVIV